MKDLIIDAVNDQCPIPVVKAKKALESMDQPGVLEVRVNDATAVENLKRLAASLNRPLEVRDLGGGVSGVRIAVDQPLSAPETAAPEIVCAPPRGATVVIGSRYMGRGDDQLGEVLMKGFIYALSQQEQLPETVLFYNGGAWLTTEGSPALEDLKALAAQGVKIFTCGTCLKHYGLSEKLAVGEVTNMYAIVEMLTAASRIIKP